MPSQADYIAAFRQANPQLADWSDADILDRYVEDHYNELGQHPALAEWATQRRKEGQGVGGEFWGAVKSGTDAAQAKLYDTAALAGRVMGSDSLQEWGERHRDENQQEAGQFRPIVEKFEDVRSPSDMAYWLANIVGSNAPQIVGTGLAAAGAAAAAPEAVVGAGATALTGLGIRALAALGMGAGEEAAAGLSVKALAGLAGSSLAGFTQMQNYGELEKLGGENIVPLAVANGLLGSVLEAAGPASMIARLTKAGIKKEAAEEAAKSILFKSVPGQAVNVALAAAKEGSKEMLTEMAQEALSVATEAISNRHNPDFQLDDEQVRSRIINSGVAGFVLGGLGGTLEHFMGHSQHAAPEAKKTAQTPEQVASLDVPIAQPSAEQVAAANARADEITSAVTPATGAAGPLGSPAVVPAPAEAPVLASPATQQTLVQFGVPAEQAATIPEDEAQQFIAQQQKALAEKQAADAAEAQRLAAAEEQRRIEAAAQAQAAQVAEEQRIAAEQEMAARQQAADRAQQALELRRRLRQSGAELEAQAEAELSARARAIKPAPIVQTLQKQEPTQVLMAQPGPGILNATIKQQQEQSGPAPIMDVPKPVSIQAPVSTASENALPSENATPVTPSAPAPVAGPAPVQTPAPAAQAPVAGTLPELSHGLHGLDELTPQRFIPRDKADLNDEKAFRATSRGDTHNPTSRFQAFERPDGKVEIRKATVNGRLAVRENMDITPVKLAEVVSQRTGTEVSGPTISKIVRGQSSKFGAEFDTQVRDIANKLGYTAEGRGLLPNDWALKKGYKWLGTVVADRDSKLRHIEVVSRDQFEAMQERTPETEDKRKTDVKVSQPVVQRIADYFNADPTILQRLDEIPRLTNEGEKSLQLAQAQRMIFEKALTEAGTPEEKAQFGNLRPATAQARIEGAIARALLAQKQQALTGKPAPAPVPATAPAPQPLAQPAPGVVARPKKERPKIKAEPVVEYKDPALAKVAYPEIRVEPANARAAMERVLTSPRGPQFADKFIGDRSQAGSAALDALFARTLKDSVKEAAYKDILATEPEKAAVIREMFRNDLKDALQSLRAKQQVEDDGIDTDLRDENGARVLGRKESSEAYLQRDDATKKQFNQVVREGASRGIKVSLREATKSLGNTGTYQPSERAVTLFLKNVTAPSTQDVISALHEIVHDATVGQPEWVRRALQDTFARLPDAEKAFYKNPAADEKVRSGQNVAGLDRETFLMEQAVEHAALQGVARDYAQGLIPAVWRTFKDLLLKAAIYLQSKIVGEDNVGGTLAKQWVENLAAGIVAGDASTFQNFLAQFGRPKTYGQILRYTTDGDHVWVNDIDPDTGVARVRENFDMSEAGAQYRAQSHIAAAKASLIHDGTLSGIEAENELREILNDPQALFSGARTSATDRLKLAMARTIADKRVAIAVANQLDRLVSRLYEAAKSINPDLGRKTILDARRLGEAVPDDLTRETFLQRHGMKAMKAQRDIEVKTLQAQIEAETGEKDFDVSRLGLSREALIDDLPKELRDVADEAFLTEVSKLNARVVRIAQRHTDLIVKLDNETEQRRATIQDDTKKLADWKSMERDVIDSVVKNLRRIAKDAKQGQRLSEAAGEARATVESLLDQDAELFDTQFTEKVADAVDMGNLPLASIFKSIFALERAENFDAVTASPTEFRAKLIDEVARNPESELKQLVGDGRRDPKATALFAAVHAFLKKDARKAAIIRLQLDDTLQRSEQINEVRAALNEANEIAVKDIMERVKKDLSRPANRVIFETLKERDAALRDQKRVAEAKRAVDLLRMTRDALGKSIAAAEQRIDVSYNWELAPGAKIFNPTDVDMPSEQVLANQAELSMTLGSETAIEQLLDFRRNMEAWLDARKDDPAQQDIVYRTMKRQSERLKVALVEKNHAMLSGLRNGYLQNFVEQMDRTGTRAGRVLGRMLRGLESAKRAVATDDFQLGKEAERTRDAYYKAASAAMGTAVRPEWEKINLYDDALFFLRRAAGLTTEEGLRQLRSRWLESEDPVAKKTALDPKLWSLYEARLLAAKKNNEHMIAMSLAYGNRVLDPKIQRGAAATLRKPIERGAEGFTFPTRLNRNLRSIFASWGNVKALLDAGAKASPFTDAALKLKTNPAQLAADLRAFFNHAEIQDTILRPLLADQHDPNVPAPLRPDGLKLHVPGALAADAFEKSGGDILDFAKRVYDWMGVEGSKKGLEAYQTSVLNHVQNTMKKLAQRAGMEEATEKTNILGLPHIAMDAVMEEDFKREWTSFPDFSVEENRANSHVILANAFLGRNLNEAREVARRVENDLKTLATQMPDTKEGRAALKASDPTKFKRIETAVAAYNDWRDGKILSAIDAEFNPESDPASTSMGTPLEVFSFIAQGMLTGLRTALKDLSSLVHPIQLERSLSFHTMARVAQMHGKLGKYMFGSILNSLFNADAFRGDWKVQAMEESGLGDPIRNLTFHDFATGTWGRGNSFEKSNYGKVQRGLRLARTVIANQRLGFGAGSVGPQLRVNFHGWTSQLQRFAATTTYMDAVIDLAKRAAGYYANNPEAVGLPVTAKHLGYMDAHGFAVLKSTLDDYGVRIEDIAQRLVKSPETAEQDILSKDDIVGIHSMAQAKVMGEGGADTRPHSLPLGLGRGTRGGRVGQTFIGWSFWKGGEAWNMLRDAEGRRTLTSVTKGALAMTLGLLPLGIAASLALDLYDDKITKKRANWRGYSADMTPEDFINVTMQRAASMGTLGLPGEVASQFLMPQDGGGQKTLSVDQRIVWVNTVAQMFSALKTLNAVGLHDANYANVGRQMISNLGGGGLLQNIQVLNGVLGPVDLPLFRQEADVTQRINMNNFLRAAGTEMKFELAQQGGSTATPNVLTPHITDMYLAAIRNDPESFQSAYQDAVEAAQKLPGVMDPLKKVQDSFASLHPLKTLFRGTPTAAELGQMLQVMPDQGRAAVQEGLALINGYGRALGIQPYFGKTRESPEAPLLRAAAMYGIRPGQASLDSVRRAAMATRSDGELL